VIIKYGFFFCVILAGPVILPADGDLPLLPHPRQGRPLTAFAEGGAGRPHLLSGRRQRFEVVTHASSCLPGQLVLPPLPAEPGLFGP
jgi:hypothetical protein